MAKLDNISADYARQLLEYCPETGDLFWKYRPIEMFEDGDNSAIHACRAWNANWAGTKIRSPNFYGYYRCAIDRQRYMAHRIAWLIYYGRWPNGCIDHKNGVRTDNRIANLFDVSHAENQQNLPLRKNSKTGYIGVYWATHAQAYIAKISVKGKHIHLGQSKDPAECAKMYLAAKAKYHTYQPIPREMLPAD
jgi:hypothetical protein